MKAKQNTPENAKCLILIDGYGFLFRAYHSMPPLTRPHDGTPVGAIYGFSNMLMKLLGDHEGDYIAVALDSGKQTFRNEIYSDYKANRPPPPEDLIPQFPLVREVVDAFNLVTLEEKGYEADDLIATYARTAKEQGLKVLVVSSDKDLMQLVDDDITMFDPLKSRFIKHEQVEEKFGVAPDKVLDILALMGDSSDNIPGVPGIGPKTAAELINRFNTLDELLQNTDQITQKKRRENLEAFKDQALLSRKLAALAFDAPMPTKIDALKLKPSDNLKLARFFKEQGFKSLLARVEAGATFGNDTKHSVKADAKKHTFKCIEASKELERWIESFKEIETISIALDTLKDHELKGLALTVNSDNAVYIPIAEDVEVLESSHHGDLFGTTATKENRSEPAISLQNFFQVLKPYLEDKSIWKVGHNIKPLLHFAYAAAIDVSPFEDCLLMAYLLKGTSSSLDINSLAEEYLGETITKLTNKSEISERQESTTHQARCISIISSQLKRELLQNKLSRLYERIERPLVDVLAEMEYAGITLDLHMLKKMSDDFAKRLTDLEKDIHQQAGCEFNIGSPKQLGEVLFEKMGIEGGKKSKSGSYGTDASVLESIAAQGHAIADHILAWRQTSKLKSTYTDALPRQVRPDGRIHTHYAMASTSTGRLSSNEPNLQNIPTRTEEGNKIRKTFIAQKGCKLISADYSQIELRLLAHMADIKTLKEAFAKGTDIHAATASQVFDIPLEEITSEIRRKAKAINFGIIYGMSAFGLASRLRISRADAKHYIDAYFKQYPGIRRYMDSTIEYAKAHGYVSTLLGRKCFIRDIQGKNPAMRQFAERAAINAPLQGTAADIIKKAMVELNKVVKAQYPKTKMLLQVHDELILEAPQSDAQEVAALVKKTMENTISLSVPLTVEVGVGDNWAEIHG